MTPRTMNTIVLYVKSPTAVVRDSLIPYESTKNHDGHVHYECYDNLVHTGAFFLHFPLLRASELIRFMYKVHFMVISF